MPEKEKRINYEESDKQLIVGLLQADAGVYVNVLLRKFLRTLFLYSSWAVKRESST